MPFTSPVWEASYNTRMSLCGNQWQDAAEIYRNWAVTQTWSKTLLRNRTDVPQILHQAPLMITARLTAENLSTLPATLKAWADLFGTRVVYEPTHWEKYYKYTGIDYFPVSIGNQPYTTLNQAFKPNNIVQSGCLESYHWTRSLDDGTVEQNSALEAFFIANNGADICRTKANGALETLDAESRNEYFLCRGTEFGKTFLQGAARQLLDLGTIAIHNDYDHLMAFDGPCYNRNHGHPVPYGSWQFDVMKDVYETIASEAKNRNITEFFLTKEWPCELYNMMLSGNQVRNYEPGKAGSLQIPLYVYIYHDYITSLFGFAWFAGQGAKNDGKLASCVTLGQIPAIAFWQNPTKPPSTANMTANATNVLKDYYNSMKGPGKNYLLYGRLLKPAIVSGTGITHNTWQDSSGNIGVFAIDTISTKVTLTVKVPGSANYLNIFMGGTLQSTLSVTGGSNYSWEIDPWRLSSLVFSQIPLTVQKESDTNSKMSVFPNPVKDFLNIRLNNFNTDWRVELLDTSGRIRMVQTNIEPIDLKSLQTGIYLLKVSSGIESFYQKIIKI